MRRQSKFGRWSQLLCALALAAAWCGCPLAKNYPEAEGPRYAGSYLPETAAPAPDTLKVVTYNLSFAEEVDTAIAALSTPELANADVIAMQEMDEASVDAIARAHKLAYVYYPGSVQVDGDDFGNALLSRWPILKDRKISLPHDDPYHQRRRIAVVATLGVHGVELEVACAHNATPIVGLGGRLDQAETIIDSLSEDGGPKVIAGDFNTSDPGSLKQTVELFQSRGFTYSSKGSGDTATSILGGLTLDSVFAKGPTAVERGVYRGESGSDHHPLWVRFAWPPQR